MSGSNREKALAAIPRMAETAGPFSTRTFAVKAIAFALLDIADALREHSRGEYEPFNPPVSAMTFHCQCGVYVPMTGGNCQNCGGSKP